ncbi:ferredoxin [Pseudonocardia kunmingensis]|uniref:Ferredoxin n=1 Tax=Pseudonocardia kunmingensis TaxID=630975 RepID=A0A543DKW0_9PSEU|nr:(4Fe-4S)-binding protein [Pseudonocardia kunmingensis]TQM09973.1 ferredoxin [Pseudonocardia kunmingensis]
MRIFADTTVCIGAGMCALTAPQVFDQGEDDGLVTVLLSDPPEELREAVAEAVRLCPSGALDLG